MTHAKTVFDPFGVRDTIGTRRGPVGIYRIARLGEQGLGNLSRVPYSIRVLLESAVRTCDGFIVTEDDVKNLAGWSAARPANVEIPFKPARVVLQDFTGVPAVVDLAAMRSAMQRLGGDPKRINPLIPVDLVIDHSVQVDRLRQPRRLAAEHRPRVPAEPRALRVPALGPAGVRQFPRRAAQRRHRPPGESGVSWPSACSLRSDARGPVAVPDTLVGTDSHTTMINGLGVVGWGVGGIEAEAVMLGQPIYMLMPEVVGFELTGQLPPGTTATDLVLTVTQMLRAEGVVGKFVEFYGAGVCRNDAGRSRHDRQHGAGVRRDDGLLPGRRRDASTTCGARAAATSRVDLVERYTKEQGLFRTDAARCPSTPRRCRSIWGRSNRAWPVRSDRRIACRCRPMQAVFPQGAAGARSSRTRLRAATTRRLATLPGSRGTASRSTIGHGAVVIAAITSCTNTSNPSVMLAAGLLAKKAVEKGLQRPAVRQDQPRSGLPRRHRLSRQGRPDRVARAARLPHGRLRLHDLHRQQRAAARAGRQGRHRGQSGGRRRAERQSQLRRTHQSAGEGQLPGQPAAGRGLCPGRHGRHRPACANRSARDSNGRPCYLKRHLADAARRSSRRSAVAFSRRCSASGTREAFDANEQWNAIPVTGGDLYHWEADSTYIQEPPFLDRSHRRGPDRSQPIRGARVLAVLGDSVTTDHISPAGSIAKDSPAGKYLIEHGVAAGDFNSYGSRRGNDRVMIRGTFANIRIRNQLAPGTEGGVTRHLPDGEQMTIYDAAMKYQARRRAAARAGRRRIRHRQQPRLGRQRHVPARRSRRDRRQLRTHPPQQPRGHGRPAAGVRRRPDLAIARPDRRGDLRHPRASTTHLQPRSR